MATSKLGRKYGWLPDIADHRDLEYKVIIPKAVRLPAKIDLRQYCSTVEDQGRLGSCTANALAGNIELLQLKNSPGEAPKIAAPTMWQKFLRWIQRKPAPEPGKIADVSRLFVYYNSRALIGMVGVDSGAYLRDGIKTLSKEGYCWEPTWPYNLGMWATRPSAQAYGEAENYKISSYYRLTTLNEMLTCLADGYPFVCGLTLYESFESDQVRDSGIVNIPGPNEGTVGGHAVMAVGYDMPSKRFIFRNSWGEGWGQKGYFTVPFEYVTKLGDDFWTIRK